MLRDETETETGWQKRLGLPSSPLLLLLLLHIMAISFSRVTPPLLKKTLPPSLSPRRPRHVIYWARENISVMEWLDAMGRGGSAGRRQVHYFDLIPFFENSDSIFHL